MELPNIKFIVFVFVCFSALMLAAIAYPRGDFVLVVGPPGVGEADMMAIIERAGGTYVAHGNLAWLAVAHAESPGFVRRLMHVGALLVLDHDLAAGCLERN